MASINSIFTNSGPQLGQFQLGALASLVGAEFAANDRWTRHTLNCSGLGGGLFSRNKVPDQSVRIAALKNR